MCPVRTKEILVLTWLRGARAGQSGQGCTNSRLGDSPRAGTEGVVGISPCGGLRTSARTPHYVPLFQGAGLGTLVLFCGVTY